MRKLKCFNLIKIFSILFLFIALNSCVHEIQNPSSSELCYSADIKPIISSNCMMSGCHGSSGGGDVDLSSYQGIMQLVSAGDPKGSELYKVITDTWFTLMPPKPNSPLTEAQRTTIYFWILQGAQDVCPDTTGSQVHVVDSVCFANDILPVFVSNCTFSNCHDAISHTENYRFTDYAYIVSRGIVPKNASSSKVYQVLNASGEDRMPPPPYNGLLQAQKDSIFKWINQGAKNTVCSGKCDTTQFTYSQTISKIITASCTGCHSGANPSFNLKLETYSDVQAIGANGLLLSVINNTDNKPLMPPSSPLVQCKKSQIAKWIKAGMPNN
jgi:hypothetical protein